MKLRKTPCFPHSKPTAVELWIKVAERPSNAQAHRPLRIGLEVNQHILGALSLTIMVDSKINRTACTDRFHLIAKLVKDLAQRLREGRQGGDVNAGIPVDCAQLMDAGVKSLRWRSLSGCVDRHGAHRVSRALDCKEHLD